MLRYIASNTVINDVVISGGDSYSLLPHHLRFIGDRLLAIPHIRRFRIATKGPCVSPSRTLDPEDEWTNELIALVKRGRECGKQIALHTHFNHPNEFSWVSREAAQKLFENGVIVRNQSVLLKGVNDSVETMGALIRELADNNIQPVSYFTQPAPSQHPMHFISSLPHSTQATSMFPDSFPILHFNFPLLF
jgi:lysine 2,3-aminomutase